MPPSQSEAFQSGAKRQGEEKLSRQKEGQSILKEI